MWNPPLILAMFPFNPTYKRPGRECSLPCPSTLSSDLGRNVSGQPTGCPLRRFLPSEWKWQRQRCGSPLVGDFLFGFQPVLNIATAELGTIEAERFAANQRDRLRFNLADMSSGLFAIHKLFGRRVTEDNVGLCSGAHKPTYVVAAVMRR